MQLIQTAKHLGFNLAEIKQMMDVVNASEIAAEQFQVILQEKLATIREKIEQLQQMQGMLENLLQGEPCPLRKGCGVGVK